MNTKALSLLEIIISAVIMTVVIGGFAAIFLSGKRSILHNRSRVVSVQLGKLFLDYLQTYTRRSDWDTSTNALTDGTRYCDNDPAHAAQQQVGCPNSDDRTLDNITYRAQYTISSPYTNIRKVKAAVSWNEPIP
jgi:hypothetical protein